MGRGALISALFHAIILAAVYFGLPDWIEPEDIPQPIPVQLATIADITTPPKQEQPTPAPTPVEKPKPPEPEPTPPPPQAETPPPEPPPPTPPEPQPQPDIVPPEPVPEETVPEPKPAAEQQAAVEPPKPVPPQKPKPPQEKPVEQPKPQEDALQSLLKNVLKDQPEPSQTPPQPNQQPTQPLTQQNLSDAPLTISEIDAIRQQMAKCWNVPAGARDAQNLAVEIRVMLNPDGSVARAEIVDTARMASDTFYRTAAESAYRAVLQCSPLQQLPVKKYNSWKVVTLNFDPREMLGQ
jgi:outer membrane biosynthesis protein TonB